jgi:hypothetical protein
MPISRCIQGKWPMTDTFRPIILIKEILKYVGLFLKTYTIL